MTYLKRTDIELLRLIKSDDAYAFEEIYMRHSGKMFLYGVKVLKKKEACEDIVQNIFIDIWNRRHTIKIVHLSSYLLRAVKYQIFNYLRSSKLSCEDLTRLNIIDFSPNISQRMEYEELEKSIYSCVNELPCRCQQIFKLSRFQHKSNKEIAEELGISLQAVKNQISKALDTIRRNLQREELVFFNFFCYK